MSNVDFPPDYDPSAFGQVLGEDEEIFSSAAFAPILTELQHLRNRAIYYDETPKTKSDFILLTEELERIVNRIKAGGRR